MNQGSDPPRLRLLSLSGGGFLGLYAAYVLAALEKQIGRPIASCFDLIAGTSVGGIIALALALEVPASEVVTLFERQGAYIFSDRTAPQGRVADLLDMLRFVHAPKYSSSALRASLKNLFGDKTLGDAKHRVIVPTVNMTKGDTQLFKTPHHPTLKFDLSLSAVDVAMATAAAPTLFPIAEIDGQLFVDGGLYANSPDLLAFHEATYYLERERDSIDMISIGTTTSRYSLSQQTGRNFGSWKWMIHARLLSVVFGAQQQMATSIMKHLLGERYLRIDSIQAREQERFLRLDVATDSAIKDIRGLAMSSVQTHSTSKLLQQILSQTAVDPTFYRDGKRVN